MYPTSSMPLQPANHRRAQYSMDSDRSLQSSSNSSYRTNSMSSSIYSTEGLATKPFKRVRFQDEAHVVPNSFFDFDSESERKPNILRRTYRKTPILSISTNTSSSNPKASSPKSDSPESDTAPGTKLRSFLRRSRSSLFLRATQEQKTSLPSDDDALLTRAAESAKSQRIGTISKPIYSSYPRGDGLSPSEMI